MTERDQLRQLKARFDAAHQRGMEGLQAHDYAALHHAIEEEREILLEQKDILHRMQERIASYHPTLRPVRRSRATAD